LTEDNKNVTGMAEHPRAFLPRDARHSLQAPINRLFESRDGLSPKRHPTGCWHQRVAKPRVPARRNRLVTEVRRCHQPPPHPSFLMCRLVRRHQFYEMNPRARTRTGSI